MLSKAIARSLSPVGFVFTILFTVGCPAIDRSEVANPLPPPVGDPIKYEEVLITIVPDPGIIAGVDPYCPRIWVESSDRPTQVVWRMRCVKASEGVGSEEVIPCPDDLSVDLVPKEGCATDLFAQANGGPGGRISISASNNAVPSGPLDKALVDKHFRWQEQNPGKSCAVISAEVKAEVDRACDSSMPRSAREYMYYYDTVLLRAGKEVSRLDPVTWIESE